MEKKETNSSSLAVVVILCTTLVGATASYNYAMYWTVAILSQFLLGNEFVGKFSDYFRRGEEFCHVGLYALIAIPLLVWNRKGPIKTQFEAIIVFTIVYLSLWLGVSYWICVSFSIQ